MKLWKRWLIVHSDTLLQASKFFNQLHIYSPESNRWTQVVTDNCPDGIAGHGATIVDDTMVVFGGYHGHGSRWVHTFLALVNVSSGIGSPGLSWTKSLEP